MTPDLRAVLFGHSVKHSRSPELFAALRRAGGHHVDFQLRDVPPDQLHEGRRLARLEEFVDVEGPRARPARPRGAARAAAGLAQNRRLV
jgi:hypothetical protein